VSKNNTGSLPLRGILPVKITADEPDAAFSDVSQVRSSRY